jgi:hypothetical protein
MNASRIGFIDAMKCLGMALIVFGHVGGALTAGCTPPVYLKQLGVAFFMFVTGYTLARERRTAAEVLYRRLFEVVFFGVAFAVLMSAITYARIADLNESNYLPFLLGVNVLMNDFPANPTTWFIGTYIHALIFWALVLRSRRVETTWLVAAVLVEIVVRGLLMARGTMFIAYMVLPNWATVFLAGMSVAQHRDAGPSRPRELIGALAGLGAMVVVWPVLAWRLFSPAPGFPFMTFHAGSQAAALGLTSASVTLVYVTFTLCIYRISRPLTAPAWVCFFSRNTPLIFIAHMPIYHGLRQPVAALGLPYGLTVALLFVIGFVGPALVSEAVRRWLSLAGWRDRIWFRIADRADRAFALDRSSP